MTDHSDVPDHFTLTIEIVRNAKGVFVQTTRDGRVSQSHEDVTADAMLAIPAMAAVCMSNGGEMHDTPTDDAADEDSQ